MKIEELKKKIEDKMDLKSSFIFIVGKSSFVAHQYAREIAKIRNLEIVVQESADFLQKKNALFSFSDDVINMFICDSFDANLVDKNTNSIIITNKVENENDKCVYVPELENWQIKDYCYSLLPGVNHNDIDALMSILKYDIDKIDSEIQKIYIFPEGKQQFMLEKIISGGGYDDFTEDTTFSLSNAIMKRDIATCGKILQKKELLDVHDYGFLTLMYLNFRNVLSMQTGKMVTPESLGVSEKQFKAIQYNCGKYTVNQLVSIFSFLTNIDYQIKSGQLQDVDLCDYITTKILTC